jgi:hypothetical protein
MFKTFLEGTLFFYHKRARNEKVKGVPLGNFLSIEKYNCNFHNFLLI